MQLILLPYTKIIIVFVRTIVIINIILYYYSSNRDMQLAD